MDARKLASQSRKFAATFVIEGRTTGNLLVENLAAAFGREPGIPVPKSLLHKLFGTGMPFATEE